MANVSSSTQANSTRSVCQSLTYGWMYSRRSKPWGTPASLSTLTGRFWKAREESFGRTVFLPWSLSSKLRLKQEYTSSLAPDHILMLSKSLNLKPRFGLTIQRTLPRTIELYNAFRFRYLDQRSFSPRNIRLAEPVPLHGERLK